MPEIIEITDFNAPELDPYARLSEAQLMNRDRPEEALFIGESPKVVERALDAGCVPVSLLMERKHIEGEGKCIIDRVGDIPVFTADFDVLTQITGFKLTRGLLCALKRPPERSLEEVIKDASRVVLLENVMNPANLGAVFRSAAALGFDAVLMTSGCTDPLYRRAIRVSMGTVFQIPWAFADENEALTRLKEEGFVTAAMALKDDSVSVDDPRLTSAEKLAVVLGTEGDGLAADTIADCDYTVKIPMAHGVDSLNVAAAGAVAFWQLGKR